MKEATAQTNEKRTNNMGIKALASQSRNTEYGLGRRSKT